MSREYSDKTGLCDGLLLATDASSDRLLENAKKSAKKNVQSKIQLVGLSPTA
jgi:hypothetical protein